MSLNEFKLKQGLEIPLANSTGTNRNKLRQVEASKSLGEEERLGVAILNCLPKHSLSGNMILAD